MSAPSHPAVDVVELSWKRNLAIWWELLWRELGISLLIGWSFVLLMRLVLTMAGIRILPRRMPFPLNATIGERLVPLLTLLLLFIAALIAKFWAIRLVFRKQYKEFAIWLVQKKSLPATYILHEPPSDSNAA